MGSVKAAIFLLTLSLPSFLLLHSHNLVSGDENLVQTQCHNTEVPYICIDCLKPDPISELPDSKGIATILMNCLSIQADILSANMSDLGSSEKDHSVKTVFQQCAKDYASAKHDLVAAKVALMNNNVKDALKCLIAALKSDVACHKAIKYLGIFPKGVFYRMTVYEKLSEAANRIIGSI